MGLLSHCEARCSAENRSDSDAAPPITDDSEFQDLLVVLHCFRFT